MHWPNRKDTEGSVFWPTVRVVSVGKSENRKSTLKCKPEVPSHPPTPVVPSGIGKKLGTAKERPAWNVGKKFITSPPVRARIFDGWEALRRGPAGGMRIALPVPAGISLSGGRRETVEW
jgi:hypothetical protein